MGNPALHPSDILADHLAAADQHIGPNLFAAAAHQHAGPNIFTTAKHLAGHQVHSIPTTTTHDSHQQTDSYPTPEQQSPPSRFSNIDIGQFGVEELKKSVDEVPSNDDDTATSDLNANTQNRNLPFRPARRDDGRQGQ